MDRINTLNRALDLFGAGKHGWKNRNIGLGVEPTEFNADWCNGTQEELLAIIEAGGVVPAAATRNQMLLSLKRLFGGNVTTVNFAASPFALTADHAGLVLVDATAGAVVLNLPVATVLAGLSYAFRRVDTTANTVTVNRASTNVIDEIGTAFTLAPKATRELVGDGVSKWSSVSEAGGTPGEIFFTAANTAPPGALKANGALISRITYAALFARMGTTFGVGDGATTFAVPDLRGEFLRGWDDARGVDAGRVFGSAQADELRSHTHGTTMANNSTAFGASGIAGGNALANASGNTTASTGGAENRPRNLALLACIKF